MLSRKVIRPFQAYLYRKGKQTALKKVLCPPYDLISEKDVKVLAACPYSFVRLENPSLFFSSSPYTKARETFLQWERENILFQEHTPSLYLLAQTFSWKSRTFHRRSLVGLLPLRQIQHKVFPHEHTLRSPKADRKKMLLQTGLQVSGVFLIANAPKKQWDHFIQKASPQRIYGTTAFGAVHTLYRLHSTSASPFLPTTSFLIADGHHRYESVWETHQQAKKVNHLFAFITNTSEDISLYSIHRLLPLHAPVKRKDWQTTFEENHHGSLRVWHNGKLITRLSSKVKKDFSEVLLLDRLFRKWGIQKEEIRYIPGSKSIAHATRNGKWGFSFAPPSIETVFQHAQQKGVLPPKTTYFFPKIPSGFLFYRMW